MAKSPQKREKKKNPAAVELGRKGGKSTAKTKSPEYFAALGKKGAETRWDKAKKDAK